jgi:hypothetical protein
LWSPASSEKLAGQRPHWPGSRSCLQRLSMTMDPTNSMDRWEDHPVTSQSHQLEGITLDE